MRTAAAVFALCLGAAAAAPCGEKKVETRVYSISGLLSGDTPLVVVRPFRSPHYTISAAGLVGGGRLPRPAGLGVRRR